MKSRIIFILLILSGSGFAETLTKEDHDKLQTYSCSNLSAIASGKIVALHFSHRHATSWTKEGNYEANVGGQLLGNARETMGHVKLIVPAEHKAWLDSVNSNNKLPTQYVVYGRVDSDGKRILVLGTRIKMPMSGPGEITW